MKMEDGQVQAELARNRNVWNARSRLQATRTSGFFPGCWGISPISPAGITGGVTRQALTQALEVELCGNNDPGKCAIIGSLVTGNSRGMVVAGLATEEEIAMLDKYRKVLLLNESMNAAGNVIMANDTFAAVHEDMPTDLATRDRRIS